MPKFENQYSNVFLLEEHTVRFIFVVVVKIMVFFGSVL